MADPKFGLSVGPYSADFTLSGLWGEFKDAAAKELQRRMADVYKIDYAVGQSAPVQALQGIELRTPIGSMRPFVPPGQEPIPPAPESPPPTRRFVSGETQYTPPPTRTAPQEQPQMPPTSPAARTVPSPTSGGTPRVMDPGLLYQAIGPEAYEQKPETPPPTPSAEPMGPPPGSEGIIQGHGAPDRPGIDWGALLKTAGAMAPKIARGLAEPSTTRPYARAGYFAQQEDIDKREQELRLSQMGADSAMARQEAENKARADMEREQIAAQLERERMSEQAAMERAKLEAQTQRETRGSTPLSPEVAASLGHPEWAGRMTMDEARSLYQTEAYASATKEAQSDRDLQRSQLVQANLQARIAQIDAQLQNPMMLANPEQQRALLQQKEVYQAQLDAIQTKYFPEMAQAAQAQRAAQLRQSVTSQFQGYRFSEDTMNALAGILAHTAPGSVDRARALAKLATSAPQDERIQIQKFLAEQAKAPAGK